VGKYDGTSRSRLAVAEDLCMVSSAVSTESLAAFWFMFERGVVELK